MTKAKSGRAQRPRVLLVNRCLIRDKKGHILFIQRAAGDSYLPEYWEAPGGKLDEGQDLNHAAEREVLEETGLLVDPSARLVSTHSEVIAGGKYKGMPYIVLTSVAKLIGGVLRLSEEHQASQWLSYERALADLKLTPETYGALIVLRDYLEA